MGRRRSRSRGRLSRRQFLAGGLLSLGGASLLGGTQAFSQVDATRAASVQTAGDQGALLGVDPAVSVQAGADDQRLVTLTNNTSSTLDVTVSLENPGQGNLSRGSTTIASGASATVYVSVASDSPTGTDALSFSVSASGGDGFTVTLTRAVDVTAGPTLTRYIEDRSGNSNTEYLVQYTVENVPDFDRVEVSFTNLDQDWGSGSRTNQSREGTISYSQGGTAENRYEITISVYDTSGSIVLQDSVEDIANGDEPDGNETPGGSNAPKLDSFTVQSETQNNNTDVAVDYEVSNLDQFHEVAVTFENQEQDWATRTNRSSSSPTGT